MNHSTQGVMLLPIPLGKFMQQMVFNIDSYLVKGREHVSVECSATNMTSASLPLSQGSGTTVEDAVEKLEEPEVQENLSV